MTTPMGPEDYVALGWHIFPCHAIVRGQCTCGKGTKCTSPGKHPRTTNGVKDASVDLNTIRMWWATWPEANIALACGRQSGVWVVDIDQRKSGFDSLDNFENDRPDGPLPETLKAISGGGGRHLFFKYPADGTPVGNRGDWLPGVDIKSDGGYVILPPGTHISGGRYSWTNLGVTPPAIPPSDLLASVRGVGSAGSGKEALPDTDNILEGVPEGKRDETLFRFACRLRRQLGDSARSAVERLVLDAAKHAVPAFPESEALRKVDQAFKQDHNDDVTAWSYATDDDEPLHHLTDIGNKNRFVQHFGDDFRYVPQWGWLQWTDIGWRRVDTETVLHTIERIPDIIRDEAKSISDVPTRARWVKWSFASESSGSISATEKLARNDDRLLRGVDEFDSDDHLLACRNGIVDLRSGVIRSFHRDDLVTKNTNVIYDPTYALPAWEHFLKQSTEGDQDMMTYLQLAAGYTLTGSNSEESFFIITGPPASGKSTFLDAMLGAMGSYATTTQSDTFMYRKGKETPKDELARLAGMRLVSMSEIREGEGFNEALIKQFTGGDRVTARFLYRDTFEFTPQFKLWIGTNHDPVAQDSAMFRRLKRVEFLHHVPYEQRDPKLKAMLRDPDIGGRAVLAWAVQGAMEFYRLGKLVEPSRITLAVHTYRAEQDSFAQFLNECFERQEGYHTPLTQVYATYVAWCSTASERSVRRPQFTTRLRERGIDRRIGEGGEQFYVGLRPKPMQVTTNGVSWG